MSDPYRQGNLFAGLPAALDEEAFETLAEAPGARLVRIVSVGQASPPGYWYDQPEAEWVVVLKGSAGLLFEGEPAPRTLGPGDHLLIPPHARHRVEWTETGAPTVWLAFHFG